MVDAFKPFRSVSIKAMGMLVVVQAICFVAWWSQFASAVIPRPGEVLAAFPDLWRYDGLGYHLWQSFQVNVQALFYTCLLSLGLSYLTVLPVMRPAVAVVSKMRFLGMAGLALIFTLMTTSSHSLKVALLTFAMTVFFVTSMADEVAAIPRARLDLARTLRMHDWRTVWEIVVLGTADRAWDVMRQNAAIGWAMLMSVEGLVRSEGGIGALLLNQNKHFHLAAVFAAQIATFLIGFAFDWCLGRAQRVACPYAFLSRARA